MRMSLAFPVIAGLLITSPVPAQITFEDAPPAPAVKRLPSDKMVCRTQETVGSRLGSKRVCLTESEWKEQERLTREAVQRIQQNVDICNQPPC
ncbi:MAG TPA: hypothetical protein VNR68_04400 [Sphingomicrobium sp.]|nr:hypothetical protein [Sphingomicrobium sp.]